MIELIDVTQHYGVRPVVRGFSLRIQRGEVVVILGPDGVGKTTLLGATAGVLSPQKGEVFLVAGLLLAPFWLTRCEEFGYATAICRGWPSGSGISPLASWRPGRGLCAGL